MNQPEKHLNWPSDEWNTTWERAIQTTHDLALARRCNHEHHTSDDPYAIVGGRDEKELAAELDELLEALSSCTIGGIPVSAVRMTWSGHGTPPHPHPADKTTLRARADAAALDLLAARLVDEYRAAGGTQCRATGYDTAVSVP